MILVYLISNSAEEAENIAMDLLTKKLIYSANIIGRVKSMRWENEKIVNLERTIMLAKTKASLYPGIEKTIKEVQTTGTVVLFSMPITQMSKDLFENIQANTLTLE
jgi:uncharacterized protein involved in tolerance to divalent cations